MTSCQCDFTEDHNVLQEVIKKVKNMVNEKCSSCLNTVNIWQCITCGHIGCGRYFEKHALLHFQKTSHSRAIQIDSLQLHCYICDNEYDYATNDPPQAMASTPPPLVQNGIDWKALSLMKKCTRIGLQNLGNTCYLNSSIQVLANIQLFRSELFQAQLHMKNVVNIEQDNTVRTRRRSASFKPQDVPVFAQLGELIRLLCCTTTGSVCPLSFVSAVRQAMPFFRGLRQQDAQEFLRFFLDRVQAEEAESIESDQQTIVSRLFRGLLRSEVTCLSCKSLSIKVDPFLDLSLDIPLFRIYLNTKDMKTRPLDLLDCMKSFTELECLHSTELYYCTTCEARQRCTKKMGMEQLPKLLVLHLKRFRCGAHLSRRHRLKLRTKITFPLKNMNMGAFYTGLKDDTLMFDLRGIVCHHGSSVGCGHYSTYSLEESTNTWLRFNDSTVTPVSAETVARCEPYIFVYAQQNK